MYELTLPKLNNNDDRYTIVEWYFEDGAWVPAGAVVAVIESSKVAEDLVVPGPGILHRAAPAGADRAVGEVIGYLFADDGERRHAASTGTGPAPVDDLVITAPARALADQLGIGEEQLRLLGSRGKRVVKRADIEALAAPAGEPATSGGTVHRLTGRQRAVAGLVTRAHTTIPAAYAAVDVHAIATPAQVIKAIGTLRERFPLHFGSYRDDGTVLVPDGASVAITIDAGDGLFMPVVKTVAARSEADIAATLDAFRRKAAAGTFTADELSGGNIGLSLHTYLGVVAAQPIVFPGQSCMLSLCSARREVAVDRSGAVYTRSVFQLGMSYDHRSVNGRDAVKFLRALKSIFERQARGGASAA